MPRTVAILGGGVAGMSAAQELAERGFSVDVYEASDDIGGKARSQGAPDTGVSGRKDLPGEHGFRFFPSFYRHIRDTMCRIPVEGGTVDQRLVPSEQMAMAERRGRFVFDRHAPRDIRELFELTETVRDFFARTDVSEIDTARFGFLMWQFLVSCDERRIDEFEPLSFWDFIRGDEYEPTFKKYLQTPRFMVAMDPRRGSARTIATKALQILLDFFRNGTLTDAVLDGPTTERWLLPWRELLDARGVRFHFGRAVSALDVTAAGKMDGARLADGTVVRADYYVLATPLERAAALVTDNLARIEPELARVRALAPNVAWMTGIQFFLRRRVEVCRGHVAYPDAEWSLSSISQGQFWAAPPLSDRFGDGSVHDILSVDVSDWFEPSTALGKRACECTREEFVEEVWRQLTESLGGELRREDLVHVHVDKNVEFAPGGATNTSPLLVHPPRSLSSRPCAVLSRIRNLFLASDYVRTNTDLASMEGANEAARRAVNGILARERRLAEACQLWSMEEEAGPAVGALKAADLVRYRAGAPTVVELAARDVLGPRRVDRGFELLESLAAVERELKIHLGWLLPG